MKWLKLIIYDMRNGLLRKQYLYIPFIVCIPCILHLGICAQLQISGGWMDYLLYCFRGIEPIILSDAASRFQLPIIWFITVCGCLFLNLDYPLNDLSHFGLQIIVRSNSRAMWYLSKCIWNIASCFLYICIASLVCFLFALFSGGPIAVQNTEGITAAAFALSATFTLSGLKCLLMAAVCPFLTLCALSMLQMLLSFLVKPVVGFLLCIGILVLSLYLPSPAVIGNGAMTIRSSFLVKDGIDPLQSMIASITIVFICTFVGTIYFQHKDVLGSDE